MSDPGNPVKQRNTFEKSALGSYTLGTIYGLNLVRNEYEVYDSWVQIFQPDKKVFYSLNSEITSTYVMEEASVGIYPMFIVVPNLDTTEIKIYTTTVINILDIFGLVGGVFELLYVSTSLIIGFIANVLFKKEIENNAIKESEELFTHPPYISHPKIKDKRNDNISHENSQIKGDISPFVKDYTQGPNPRLHVYEVKNDDIESEDLRRK